VATKPIRWSLAIGSRFAREGQRGGRSERGADTRQRIRSWCRPAYVVVNGSWLLELQLRELYHEKAATSLTGTISRSQWTWYVVEAQAQLVGPRLAQPSMYPDGTPFDPGGNPMHALFALVSWPLARGQGTAHYTPIACRCRIPASRIAHRASRIAHRASRIAPPAGRICAQLPQPQPQPQAPNPKPKPVTKTKAGNGRSA
jgi:hypothetical protein